MFAVLLVPVDMTKYSMLGVVVAVYYINLTQLFFMEMFGTMAIVMIVTASLEEFRDPIWSGNLFTTFPFAVGSTVYLIVAIFVSIHNF